MTNVTCDLVLINFARLFSKMTAYNYILVKLEMFVTMMFDL